MCCSLTRTVQRAPLAAVPFLPEILPNVFVLCRTIHRLWKPGHDAHTYVRATYPVVFAPDPHLYETLTGRKVERDFGVFFATWLQQLREQTYKVSPLLTFYCSDSCSSDPL
jgi:hypothetical protein